MGDSPIKARLAAFRRHCLFLFAVASVVVCSWSCSGREDGVYQPVSTSCRAQPAEGRAAIAGACRAAAPAASSTRTLRRCGERQPDRLAARDKGTSRRRAVRAVAEGNEPPAFLLQRPWSCLTQALSSGGLRCPQPLVSGLLRMIQLSFFLKYSTLVFLSVGLPAEGP